jgi:hypothetical protein
MKLLNEQGAPCRTFDTRAIGTGHPFSGTLTPPVDVVDGPCGVPASAQAYVFNATVIPSPALNFLPSSATVPELEQSKAAVLGALASPHSRRAYKHAIDQFIGWYCSEPRLGFNRSVVVRYRSFVESRSP